MNSQEEQQKRSTKKRKLWVRRNKRSIYNNLIQELRYKDIDECKSFLKITPEVFDELLRYIEIDITE